VISRDAWPLVLSLAFALGCSAVVSPTQPPTLSPSASLQPSPSPSATNAPSPATHRPTDARTRGWQSDIDALIPRMDAFHPALDHGSPLSELTDAASILADRVPELTDDELMIHVVGLVSLVSREGRDGHTGAYVWGSGAYPVDSLPLRLWLFDDGVYIVDALPPYENLVGSRIDSINGHPTQDVIDEIDPIVPRDNAQTVRLLMPRFLLIPQVLRGFGFADPTSPVVLGFGAGTRSPRAIEVEPVPMADYNAWAGAYGLFLPGDPDVPYLSRINEDIWWERFDDGTLFVQYNRVEFSALSQLGEIEAAATDPATTRVVLDLRHNYGGEASALDPVLDLFLDPRLDRPRRLFVITGRNTFSAGSTLVARLDAESSAVIVGEPMGGAPTFWADIESFVLPYSGIPVSVSTTFEVGVSATDERLTIQPDVPATLTPEDWAAGIDPALAAIREYRP
jgi:hypothetical protein